jgi:glycerol-3-phosphate dehydrogenase
LKIVVIGGGIAGTLIARLLSFHDVDVTLIEKENDVGWGVTKANSGIIHAGYDDEPGTLRASLVVPGNEMFTELSKELGFEFERIGSHVLAFSEDEIKVLEKLYKQGETNGVKGLKILDRDEVLSMIPKVNPEVKASLYAPSAGIILPWEVPIRASENFVKNGGKLVLGERVVDIVTDGGRVRKVITDKNEYEAEIVVNAAGLFADEIAKMAGAEFVPLHPRKGEYILLDTTEYVNAILFPTPSHGSKGTLVLPTVSGNTMIGPNAVDLPPDKKDDLSTTKEGLKEIYENAKKLVPSLTLNKVLRTFAGLRPESPQRDFFIKASEKVWGFVNVAAIRSPGLTSAPAIAEYVVDEVIQQRLKVNLEKKKNYVKTVEKLPKVSKMSIEEWKKLVEKDERFGNVVCVCNRVTEGEIVEAIRRGARTLDAIKFRTEAMFGPCQGGRCVVKIARILSRETGMPFEEILYNRKGSNLVVGKVRP